MDAGGGLNADSGDYGDMVKFGVVDPTKVTRSALQNAASIAALFLTTEAVVAEKPEKQPAPPADEPEPIRGAAARIVANMEASLAVPTATSARVVPARLLEVNRKVLNGYLARTGGGKVSFTHLIGYAVVKAVAAVPAMNSAHIHTGQGPRVVRHPHIGLGQALMENRGRTLHAAGSLMLDRWQGADRPQFRIVDLALDGARLQS